MKKVCKAMHIALIVVLYAVEACGILAVFGVTDVVWNVNVEAVSVAVLCLCGVACVFAVAATVTSLAFAKASPATFKFVATVKLVLIPFYVINFALWAVLMLGLLNPFLMWAIFVILPVSLVATYCIMLVTGVPNLVACLRAARAGDDKLRWSKAALVCHFVFCLDVVAAVALCRKNCKSQIE